MKAEIISIGTELLMGYTVDTNSAEIAQELLDMGIGTYYRQIIGDNPVRMREAVEIAAARSDLVIFSGGLGPTADDITKQVVAEFAGDELVEDEKQLKKVVDYFKEKGEELPSNIYRQALTFKKGVTFFNEVGLACGSAVEKERLDGTKQYFVLLPGPPYEMQHMLRNYAKPYLQEKVQKNGVIESMYLNLYGIGESKVSDMLDELIESQTNPTIAIYAKPRQVTVRLTANAPDRETAEKMNTALAEEIVQQFNSYFIGCGEKQTVETYVVEQLFEKDLSLSIVEGFTGGEVMASLASVSGVSSVFEGGFIANNEAISRKLFDLTGMDYKAGEELAVELAKQCAKKSGTDIGLSVIGDISVEENSGTQSGTAYMAAVRKGHEPGVKVYPIDSRPNEILRLIAKNETLALLKDTVQ